jgi:hypothetical protein
LALLLDWTASPLAKLGRNFEERIYRTLFSITEESNISTLYRRQP